MARGPSWTKEEDAVLKKCWEKGDSRSERIELVK